MTDEQRAAALRLADELERPYWNDGSPHGQMVKAADLLRDLAAEPEPEYEVLDSVDPLETRRQWVTASAWLYPGDRIVVMREPAAEPVLKAPLSMDGKRIESDLAAAPVAEPVAEPVAWIEGPHGALRRNSLYKLDAPQSVAWSLPLYLHQQDTALRKELDSAWQLNDEVNDELTELREAAQAVVDRWDTPNWRLTGSTASLIERLRKVLEAK